MYRDNGLACFENVSGPQTEKVRKDVIKIFKQEFNKNLDETFIKPFNGKISTLTNQTMIPYISMLTPTTHQTLPKISGTVYQSE